MTIAQEKKKQEDQYKQMMKNFNYDDLFESDKKQTDKHQQSNKNMQFSSNYTNFESDFFKQHKNYQSQSQTQHFKNDNHQSQTYFQNTSIDQSINNSKRQQIDKNKNRNKKNQMNKTIKNKQYTKNQTNNEKEGIKKITLNDIFNINIQRQQYLKSLPQQQIQRTPQFQFIINRNDNRLFIAIAHFYYKVIPDEDFNGWIKQTRRSADIRQLCLFSMMASISVLFMASIKKYIQLKPKYMIGLPVGLFSILCYYESKANEKTVQFMKEYKNQLIIKKMVKKYICQTNRDDKQYIYVNR